MSAGTRLGAATALGALALAAWGTVLFSPQTGVSIANHTGEVLRGVEVCVQGGDCVSRALWPHASWRVRTEGDGACVEVRVPGEAARRECVNVYDRPGVRLAVKAQGGLQALEE